MLDELKREAYQANLALAAHGLVQLTFGNASAIDRAQGIFAIKPSGVDYAALRPEDMVLVDLEGRKVEGRLHPSSDTPTHRRLFHAFPGIGGIVHTHSTHADHFFGEVPVTRKLTADEMARDYAWETGNVIVERFGDPRFATAGPAECPAVLVNRHAPFAWGDTVARAVETAVALECCAQMAALSPQLSPALAAIEPELLDRHFHRKHGAGAYYGQR